jgi:hypothetical protein
MTKSRGIRKRRTTLSLGMKITLVEAWPASKARGTSLKAFALDNEVQPAQIRQWTKNLDTLKEARVKFGISRQTAHGGRVSSLDCHKDTLLQWLFELRQDGMTVSIRLLSLQVTSSQTGCSPLRNRATISFISWHCHPLLYSSSPSPTSRQDR